MDLNILTNKFEEFNNKLKSDNLKDLNNLNDQIVNFLRKYKSISRDYKFKSLYKEIRLLLTKICKKALSLSAVSSIRFCAGPLSVIKVLPLSLKLFHQEMILHTMAYLADTKTPMKISIPQ